MTEEQAVHKTSMWQALLILAMLDPGLSDPETVKVLFGARKHIAADLNLPTTPTPDQVIAACARKKIELP